jgi:hypothetical protein
MMTVFHGEGMMTGWSLRDDENDENDEDDNDDVNMAVTLHLRKER